MRGKGNLIFVNNKMTLSCNNSYVIILLFILILYLCFRHVSRIEGFDATGLVLNQPPNWFLKETYDPNAWVVNNYIDSIQPSCLSYSLGSKFGSLENLNYLKSATRFWRM